MLWIQYWISIIAVLIIYIGLEINDKLSEILDKL